MAIFHLSAKPISRSTGRSATGAAAYRAGEVIIDERTGQVHDYTRKAGVLHSEIILPGGGTASRSEFWNGIEKHHKRGDAVLVREVEVSLPTELSKDERQALAIGFARDLADHYGVAADIALHAPRTVTAKDLEKHPHQYHETDPKTGRHHNGNWHAHIMLSACHVAPDGTLGKKAVALDPIHCQRAKIENMADLERKRWGERVNAALERSGHENRVDHRSLEAQGIKRESTRHLGPAASGFERRTGEPSRRRQDFEQEATERIASAKTLGELERQGREIDHVMIDLSGDITKAKSERDHQRSEAKNELEGLAAQFLANYAATQALEKAAQEFRDKQAIEQQAQRDREAKAELEKTVQSNRFKTLADEAEARKQELEKNTPQDEQDNGMSHGF